LLCLLTWTCFQFPLSPPSISSAVIYERPTITSQPAVDVQTLALKVIYKADQTRRAVHLHKNNTFN
jgi:hypothetical protein